MSITYRGRPNTLGRVLGYLANASSYAKYIRASAMRVDEDGRHRGFFQALSLMAERDEYTASESLDVDAVYRLAITSAWFFSGVKLIADRIASNEASFEVKERIEEELRDIKNHPFEVLMQRPNNLMTRDFILTFTVFWYYLKGEAYLFLSTVIPGYGEPEEIWPLPANAMRPLPNTLRKHRMSGKPCIDYEYTVNGQRFLLPGENIIHIRNPNPFDYWSGLSFATAMLQFLRIDYEQGKFTEEYYGKDNGIPTAIIALPAAMDQNSFEAAKEQIREEFGQKRRSAIIRAGDFTVQILNQDFQKADFVNMRKFNRDSLWQILGIPEGINSGAMSGDSRLAAEIAFIRNTVQPLLDRIAAEFAANAAPYYGSNITIVAPSIVPQDRAMKMQEYTVYSPDRLINENRRILGLPEIEQTGIPYLDMFLLTPTRLHAYIPGIYTTLTTPEPEPEPETPETPLLPNDPEIIGDMNGVTSPKNEMAEQTGKSAIFEATQLGLETELKRWRKACLGDVKKNINPGNRAFATTVIPPDVVGRIKGELNGRDEAGVRSVFDAYFSG